MIKRTFLLTALLCGACIGGVALWESQIEGDYYDADLYPLSSNEYFLTTLTDDEISVFHVDDHGKLAPQITIPIERTGVGLNVTWIDDAHFAFTYLGEAVRFASVESGVLWSLSFDKIREDFNVANPRIAGLSVERTPTGTLLLLGYSYADSSSDPSTVSFMGEYDVLGNLISGMEIESARSPEIEYLGEDFFIVNYWDIETRNLANELTQKLDYSFSDLPFRTLDDGETFQLGSTQGYVTQGSADGEYHLRYYDWNDQLQWQVHTNEFQSQVFTLDNSDIVTRDRTGFNRYDLKGELISHQAIDFGYEHLVQVNDTGHYVVGSHTQYQVVGGVVFDPIVDGGSVGLNVDGKVFEFDKIDFQSGSLLSSSYRSIVTEKHRETILVSDCSFWCRWEYGLDFDPGFCELYDVDINNDGTIVTANGYCDDNGDQSALVVSKY